MMDLGVSSPQLDDRNRGFSVTQEPETRCSATVARGLDKYQS